MQASDNAANSARIGDHPIIAHKPHVAFFEQRDPAALILVALRVLVGHAYPGTNVNARKFY